MPPALSDIADHYTDTLDLAVIGNCQIAALINTRGRIVWSCLPRLDGDPVFCSLVDGGEQPANTGFWDIALENFARSEQEYLPDTAVLITRLYDTQGNSLKITDFAPRFPQDDGIFRPAFLCRIIEPLSGKPRACIRVRPRFEYGAASPRIESNEQDLNYIFPGLSLQLAAGSARTAVEKERILTIDRAYSFVLNAGERISGDIHSLAQDYLAKTLTCWRDFSRRLAVPAEWRDVLVRAAITLQICAFEDTGAIVAALTTSVPESPDSGRNWDYRYCWMRDSLFTITALNRLGATDAMNGFLDFLLRRVDDMNAAGRDLQPLYGLRGEIKIEEREAPALRGYRGMGPVRVGNAAYLQQQNDVWGSAIMAVADAFGPDAKRPGTIDDFYKLEPLGERAAAQFDKTDAGIWEFRTLGRVHTFSAVMCWVACDRLARMADYLGLNDRQVYWRQKADAMHAVIMKRAWNEEKKSFIEPFDGDHLDASLLLLHEVGFIDGKDPKFVSTVAAIERELLQDGFLYRYRHGDDFGGIDIAFTICTFWYVDALAATGRVKEAREKFEWLLARRNHVGLLSEDMDFKTSELWGNFPQTYSLYGIISSALRLSRQR